MRTKADGRPSGRDWRRLGRVLVLLVAILPLLGQRRNRGGMRPPSTDFAVNNVRYDGRFTFVRFRFTPDYVGWATGNSYFGADYWWDHDYPRGESHLATILREITGVDPNREGTNILGADDDDLARYPITYVSEPGHWTVNPEEAAKLRSYVLKGGFLIFDDFRDRDHWANFEMCLLQVLPDARLIPLDVTHPIFHSFFDIQSLEATGQPYGLPTVFYGVFEDNDPTKRLLLIANYNNDIGESWEWSDTGYVSIDLTNEAYKLGVNYIVYAMTH